MRRPSRLLTVACLAAAVLAGFESLVAADDGSVALSVNPNPLEVSLQVQSSVFPGEVFQIDTTVENHGSSRLREVRVEIGYPQECLRLIGPSAHVRGALQAESTFTARWRAVADGSCANLVLVAVVRAEEAGNRIEAESVASVVEVQAP